MRSHFLRTLFWIATLACAGDATRDTAAAADTLVEVDLELVLAVDVSSSIDHDEHILQRQGYVAAFRHPDIVRAIESGPFGRIAVVYYEWAGPAHQSVAVPWTVIDDQVGAEAFADKLAAQPILPEAGTSISASLAFAERLFPVSGAHGLRRAIDISGDGANNDGPAVASVRGRLIAKRITINGLPIERGGRAGITDYYEQCVIGGPGAFTITVEDQSQFAEAIRRKLTLEIAWRIPIIVQAAYAAP
jgi:hypothetical protein